MKRKNILALCLGAVMLMSACGGNGTPDNTQDNTEAPAALAADNESAPAEAETEAAAEDGSSDDTAVPEITEDFAGETNCAKARGSSVLSVIDDSLAADGKALKIENRTESWNGADFMSEEFRGNTIDVAGSFRSANKQVRVSIQYNIEGSASYNYVFSVNTTEDKYSSGKGSFEIPEKAEKIMVYIESDNLEDIYCDDLSVKVNGEYIHFGKPKKIVFKDTSDYPSLCELYKEDFRIGMATTTDMLATKEYSELIKRQFNSITLGNSYKPDSLLDRTETLSDTVKYNECPAVRFDNVKTEMDFARDNGMTVRGHTLVWHSQTPDWIFYKDYDVNGELADRELMLRRMENYIKAVMEWSEENYPGLISAWDVVNEAADDNGGMRKSLWYETIGDDYVRKAFEYARRYAPEGVKLFYNDYNAYQARKQIDILKMLEPIVEDGNIDGVGMQSHINTDIDIDTYIRAMKRYNTQLGVEINVTELDIGRKKKDGWETVQGSYYNRLMSEMIKARREGLPLTSVTIWGLTDAISWKASEYPLIFADDLSPKPAFDGMVKAAEDANR